MRLGRVVYVLPYEFYFTSKNNIAGGHIAHIIGVVEALIDKGYSIDIISDMPVPSLHSNRVYYYPPAFRGLRNLLLRYRNKVTDPPIYPYFKGETIKRLFYFISRPIRGVLFLSGLFWSIFWRLKKSQVAFVYCRHNIHGFIPAIVSWIRKIPFVVEVNTPCSLSLTHYITQDNHKKRIKVKWLELVQYRFALVISVVSPVIRDWIINNFDSKNIGEILLNPNGVDLRRFSTKKNVSPIRHQYGIKKDEILIGMVSVFVSDNAIEELVESFYRARQIVPNLRLMLMGESDLRQMLEEHVIDRGLNGPVIFTGRIPFDLMPSYLAACDILVSYSNFRNALPHRCTIKHLEYMAAAIAGRGFQVIGVDVSQRAVDLVNAGHEPVQETNLEETIAAHKDRIRTTMSHQEAILNSDLSFVIVPTPSDDRGAFSLQYAAWVFKEIGRALAEKKDYHNVILTSTVLPGSTRYGLLPILDRESGKKCGPDFGLCYSPEFIALGSVIKDFLHPDFTLVGEFDEHCGSQLEESYARIMPDNPPCMRMSLENAELTKISLNAFVTTKISFANMLAELCEMLPGGDVDVVTNALGHDRRIGPKYLKGGGGPCFPRDNVALSFIARATGAQAELSEMTERFNRAIPGRIVQRLKTLIPEGATVAVLGMAYKPHSHVIEESQGITLAKTLSHAGARVIAYDPLALEGARTELAYHAVVIDTLADCLQQADVVLVTTPDPEFCALKAGDFMHKPVTVVDFWRILDRELSGQPDIFYVPMGRSTEDNANAVRLKTLWGSV